MSDQPHGSGLIAEEDVRAIVRLLADVAVLDGTVADKKRHLMRGIAEFLEADSWEWVVTTGLQSGPDCVSVKRIHDGYDEKTAGLVVASQQDPDVPFPGMDTLLELTQKGSHFTMSRPEFAPDEKFFDTEWYHVYGQRVMRDQFIFSLFPMSADAFSGCGLHRRDRDRPFTERESSLFHMVIGEVAWLHHADALDKQAEQLPRLTPRQRAVVTLMLEGHDRKKIAYELELSPHTVADHMKAIYRHFGVSGRSELFLRFMSPTRLP